MKNIIHMISSFYFLFQCYFLAFAKGMPSVTWKLILDLDEGRFYKS